MAWLTDAMNPAAMIWAPGFICTTKVPSGHCNLAPTFNTIHGKQKKTRTVESGAKAEKLEELLTIFHVPINVPRFTCTLGAGCSSMRLGLNPGCWSWEGVVAKKGGEGV